ncbi:hypothetical protein ACIODW_25305 [Streptomyces sp. NPDC087897]|uniref:hypothetical protein n=1 Tax=Streptomyces sp. NPDC087897 TaxID=3365817 RepID=UPI0037FB4BBC
MARRQADPAVRRAREAPRRAAAAQRIGPRPPRVPRPRRTEYLFDLKLPGAFYADWEQPTGAGERFLAKVVDDFGADSPAVAVMRVLLHYRETYGPSIPMKAVGQRELLLNETDLAARLSPEGGLTDDDVRAQAHALHARGLLFVADDGSLWRTVPPGTPYSAPDGRWSLVEQLVRAPTQRAGTAT